MRILIDTREKESDRSNYTFGKWGVETERVRLKTGDYSLDGYADKVSVERKTIDDLMGVLTQDRDRFERELARSRELDYFAVVVEASMGDISNGRYVSRANPHAMMQSIFAMSVRYRVPFFFAGNRAGGEYTTYSLLQKYLAEQTKPVA